MEGKSKVFTIVLLGIITFLTLTLAVLAGYIFIGNGNNLRNAERVEAIKVPLDKDLSSKILYGEKSVLLNLKNENKQSPTPPVIKLNIELWYFKKIKGLDVELKLTTYDKRIKEIVSTYFQNMTLNDAMIPETKKKAREDLIKKINEVLTENEDTKKPIIYNIVFDEWFYT